MSPVELMRSRYSAFATGEVEHLVRTLHPSHPDCELPRGVLVATLRNTCKSYRYTGLTIEDHAESGETGSVTFLAKVFDRGIDRSFRERSAFERVDGSWRYLSGETHPTP